MNLASLAQRIEKAALTRLPPSKRQAILCHLPSVRRKMLPFVVRCYASRRLPLSFKHAKGRDPSRPLHIYSQPGDPVPSSREASFRYWRGVFPISFLNSPVK